MTDESDTTDNCSASVKVTVPPPDLRISTIAAPSSIIVGESFNLLVTVLNVGEGESPATTLRYYRSTDATITKSDTQVGTDDVGVLSASGMSAESVSLTAPSSDGTYYYGACVDTVTDESDTTNNCSSSAQIVVEEQQQQQQGNPDLEVGSPTVSDSSPTAGTNFLLSATVSNNGDGEAPATGLRYYRSTDASIATSDTEVGFGDVGVLSASGTSAESIWAIAPATAGTYYYGACVDAVTDESDTSNNCSAAVQVDVAEPQDGIDLAVDSFTMSDASLGTNGYIVLRAIVNNNGDAGAPATTLRFYRSTDATITTSDTELHSTTIVELAALGSTVVALTLVATTDAGTYYYGACVDAVAGESDTTNNCSTSSASLVVN